MSATADRAAARMAAEHRQLEAFQRAVSDHRFTSEYVVAASHGQALFDERHPDRRRHDMRRFLAEHVVKHFATEEQEVFPALRAGSAPAIGRIIDELIEEHEAMLVQARALRQSLDGLNSASRAEEWERVAQDFRGFLRTLLDHSVKEDNLFLALKQRVH